MNITQHTPTPLIAGETYVYESDGVTIFCSLPVRAPRDEEGLTSLEVAKANARFIVTACNSHAKLVEALSEAIECLEHERDNLSDECLEYLGKHKALLDEIEGQ